MRRAGREDWEDVGEDFYEKEGEREKRGNMRRGRKGERRRNEIKKKISLWS